MDIIQHLVKQLGVNEDQAKGGAGLLLNMVKEKLGDNFSQVQEAIPEASALIDAAPTDEGGEESGGGLLGAIGGIASTLGIGGGLAGLAGLAGGFSKLGLDAGMITKFIPSVLEFVESVGGEQLKSLLAGILSGDDD